jgi:hypothetical protein
MRLVICLTIAVVLSLAAAACAQSHGDVPFPSSVADRFGQNFVSDEVGPNSAAGGVAGPAVFQGQSPAVSMNAVSTEGQPIAGMSRSALRDCEPCDDCWHWDLQFMSLIWWRDNDSSNPSLVRPHEIDFDTGGGSRIMGRMMMNPYEALEAQWFGWGAEGGRMYYNPSNFYVTNYESSLSNGEISYVHRWNRFSLLGGFRALRWSETYEELHTPQGAIRQLHTDNDLLGGQVGARWRQDRQAFYWELTGKFGFFANNANQSQIYRYGYGKGNSEAFPRGYDFTTSVLYDINLAIGFRLSPIWSVRAGYDFLFIDRLALAPNQFSNVNTGRITTDGNVMLNGLEVGLEAMW